MLFNSLQFVFFFIVVSILYYCLRQRGRVWLLLLASCYFYMAFRPIYIVILLITILIDYYAGILIQNSEGRKKKIILIVSLISNIGFLGFFKYFNFFNDNLTHLFELFGYVNHIPNYPFELPIGLSFHTFQAMSYTIEVYRKNQKAEKDFIVYSLYVMFYPQLVAGPIERPQNLLWQFHSYFKYNYENIKEGLIRIAWGLFKKVVIADRLSILVDYCYDNPSEHSGLTLLVATFFFTFQIYCDFSGYSYIAIGAARVMGYNLMENFNAPYFSKSIAEFWKRWHISLSTWFRDYLYIPLGGNRVGKYRLYLNYLIVFTVSGFWHGAAWTFIIWGALHGLFLVLGIIKNQYFKLTLLPEKIRENANVLGTFLLVSFTWIFFRARGISNAKTIISKITNLNEYSRFESPFSTNELLFSLFLIGVLLLKDRYFSIISTSNNLKFYGLFTFLLLVCYFFGVFSSNQFIYFQF